MKRPSPSVWLVSALVLGASTSSAREVHFQREVAPLLAERCLGCHAGPDAEGQLDLTSRAKLLQGGESGPALVPGDPAASRLWQRVAADEMPEGKPLPADEKAVLLAWIRAGARWEGGALDPRAHSTPTRAGLDWWSLQPLLPVSLPRTRSAWGENAIDTFVLARLEAKGLSPSPQAQTAPLVRRLTLDVTGLPPTGTMQALARRPQGYAHLVDALLSSPRYGEAWARHWLDVVRFGESHGFEYNQPRNHAWHYRNWIIDAFNADLPYDHFVRQQIAGDADAPDNFSAWAAVGFLVAGPHNTTKPSSQKMRMTMRHDELEDIVGTIGQTFLGLTVNCARCHDHKFDPISQREYYQMVASVVGIDHGEREFQPAEVREAKQELANVRARMKAIESAPTEADHDGNQATLLALKAKEKRLAALRGTRIYTAISKQPPAVSRLARGDVSLPAEPAHPGGLVAINASLASFGLDEKASDAARRKHLASWLTAEQNPLLARVIVNRLWHYHFGQGLVRTPSDFGFNGDRPSHPDLLDYLATRLIEWDWHLKPLQRLILTSATYKQSSRPRAAALAADADNRLLWRMAPRRLTAEQLRDAMLVASGQLVEAHGGAGYRDVREYKYRGSHYYDPIEATGPAAMRRTVYRFRPRGAKRTILDTFDCPDPSAKAPNRAVTTTPLQALSLWNNDLVLAMANHLAARVTRQNTTPATQVRALYQWVLGRAPTADEVASATAFTAEHGWESLARVLFNSNEFLHIR